MSRSTAGVEDSIVTATFGDQFRQPLVVNGHKLLADRIDKELQKLPPSLLKRLLFKMSSTHPIAHGKRYRDDREQQDAQWLTKPLPFGKSI